MNNRERAIVMAYTGAAMLVGSDFDIFHKYIEEILGRPVWTHELANREVQEQIHEASRADFLGLCKPPHPMTLEELSVELEKQFLWVEPRGGRIYCLEVLGVHISAYGVVGIDFNLPSCVLELSTKSMGEKWRIWTSQPTNEQREAVPWNAAV